MHTGARVTAVTADGVQLASGDMVPAELVVWAAGVKAPEFLRDLAGLETNRINQLVVRPTLQTTRDEPSSPSAIAARPLAGPGGIVPPRAQAAHQQASHLVRQIRRRLRGQPLKPWRYRDFGSLVSLGEYSTVGNLMGSLVGGNLWVEGLFARAMYLSLYKMHQVALHGRGDGARLGLALADTPHRAAREAALAVHGGRREGLAQRRVQGAEALAPLGQRRRLAGVGLEGAQHRRGAADVGLVAAVGQPGQPRRAQRGAGLAAVVLLQRDAQRRRQQLRPQRAARAAADQGQRRGAPGPAAVSARQPSSRPKLDTFDHRMADRRPAPCACVSPNSTPCACGSLCGVRSPPR